MIKHLKYLMSEEAERAGTVQPGAEKAQGALTNVYKYLMAGSKKGGARLFSVVSGDTGDNGHKLKYRRSHLNLKSGTGSPQLWSLYQGQRARGGGEQDRDVRDVESASEDTWFRVLPDLTTYGQRSHRADLRKGLATTQETPCDHTPPPAPAQNIENFLEQEPCKS
ncbi:hypothetical protein QYF61_014993 [Mycteria americana]|uniref:Uncharacterized protein n=1 Tax=Mycteria americana TaxID=33587 RepID=A0AAN7SIA0_MYCAM|nr:hypothetical protein QYF61_014993 [Mycteria americana]